MKKLIKNIICSLLPIFFLLLQSCFNEQLPECNNFKVTFHYINNALDPDKYPTDVEKVDLFVFDSNGIFQKQYSWSELQLNKTTREYTGSLPLTPGSYTFVTWGNLSEEYQISPLIPSKTTISEAKVLLKTKNQNVEAFPSPLYYGSVEVSNENVKKGSIHVDLTKNANKVNVTIIETSNLKSTFLSKIESSNDDYNFDNKPTHKNRITYFPQVIKDDANLSSEFVVLRLFKNDNTRLIITNTNTTLFNEHLPSLILKNPNLDLDRDDYFNVVVAINSTNMSATITVNGWLVTNQGGSIS